MNPQKVRRDRLSRLEDLPNIGKAMADDLRLIGIREPQQLAGRDAFEMYEALCEKTGQRHDPCVIDVFMSIVAFMRGGEALPWWAFTPERKRKTGRARRPEPAPDLASPPKTGNMSLTPVATCKRCRGPTGFRREKS